MFNSLVKSESSGAAVAIHLAVLANCSPPPPGVDPGGLANEAAELYLGEKLAPRESAQARYEGYAESIRRNRPAATITAAGSSRWRFAASRREVHARGVRSPELNWFSYLSHLRDG